MAIKQLIRTGFNKFAKKEYAPTNFEWLLIKFFETFDDVRMLYKYFPALGKNGTNQYSESGCNNITPTLRRGTDKTYIIKRLKRDNPELAEQVIEGKISAHKASIEAGWGKPVITITVSVESFAKAIMNKLNDDERNELKQMI